MSGDPRSSPIAHLLFKVAMAISSVLRAPPAARGGAVTGADQFARRPAGAVNELVCPSTNPFLSSRFQLTCP